MFLEQPGGEIDPPKVLPCWIFSTVTFLWLEIGWMMWPNYEPLNLMTWVIISWIYPPPRCHWQRKGLVRDPRVAGKTVIIRMSGDWASWVRGIDPTIFHTSWPQIMDSCSGHYITNPTQGTIFSGEIPENYPTCASSLIPKNTGNLMDPWHFEPFLLMPSSNCGLTSCRRCHNQQCFGIPESSTRLNTTSLERWKMRFQLKSY